MKYHLHIGPACAKVRKLRTAKVLLIKSKSNENSVKETLTKLLYSRGDANRSDYKANRKADKHTQTL